MFTCQNCGKTLHIWDNAYFLMQIPPRSLTEVHTFLKNNAVVYCPACLELIYRRATLQSNQTTI